jgi:fructose-bisphosphate aldolase class I
VTAQDLIGTARALVADDKGLLAMDESTPTCNRRFAALGIPQIEEARRAYRELIVTTPGLGECVSGIILYDETIRQQKQDGTPFVKAIASAGIIPGIKVDMSNYRACSIVFDCPSVGPVSFYAFHIRPTVKPSPFKDGLPIFD